MNYRTKYKIKCLIQDFISFLWFIVPVIMIFTGLGVVVNSHERYTCDNYKEITGKNTKHASFDSCYVETDEGYQRWDEYMLRSTASEGLSSN